MLTKSSLMQVCLTDVSVNWCMGEKDAIPIS